MHKNKMQKVPSPPPLNAVSENGGLEMEGAPGTPDSPRRARKVLLPRLPPRGR